MSWGGHVGVEDGARFLSAALCDVRINALAPAPRLKPSEWAEANIKLSNQTSPGKAGQLNLYPYQRDILDMMVEDGLEVLSLMKSARVGYTQLLAILIVYYLAHRAVPVLSVFPIKQDARYFEKTYLRPLFRENPELAGIIPDLEDQQWDSKTTLRGSSLELHQAEKYDTFRAFNADLGTGDEIDAPSWAPGKGEDGEGDKITLFRNRVEASDTGRLLLGSTPTVAGRSQIEAVYKRGDQRRRFVPCPHCGEYQVLEWGGRDTAWGVKWPKDRPADAYYVCRHNGCIIDESHKMWMDERGEFRATTQGDTGFASAHISALYSHLKKAKWGRLAEEFVEANRIARDQQNTERLKSFVNSKRDADPLLPFLT